MGPKGDGIREQVVELVRPAKLSISRATDKALSWWYAGDAKHTNNAFVWPDGTQLTVARGNITAVKPDGFVEAKQHYEGMKFADPHPFVYPTVTVEPTDGKVVVEVSSPETMAPVEK